ncbi:MAG: hypothetical protein R6U27_15865 [Desulfobacterales bacterium]
MPPPLGRYAWPGAKLLGAGGTVARREFGDPPNKEMGTRIKSTTSKGTNDSFSL